MPKITSLLPVPGARSSTLVCPEMSATCPRHPANRLVPKASISKRAKCKPTHPATLSTTLLYPLFLQLGSCSFSSLASFKAPSFSLTYPFYTAPFYFICLLSQTFVIFQEPVYLPQGHGFLLPLLQGHGFLPPPHPPCCTTTCSPQNVNKLPIFLEADFNCQTDAQVGAHLSMRNCWEDALADTSASNRIQSVQLGS